MNESGMEQVFFRLHLRFTTTVTKIFGRDCRRWMEYISLAYAFALAIVLVALQSKFVNRPTHCLSEYMRERGLDPYSAEVIQISLVSCHKKHVAAAAEGAAAFPRQCFEKEPPPPIIPFFISSKRKRGKHKEDNKGIGSTARDECTGVERGRPIGEASARGRRSIGADELFPSNDYIVERSYLFSLEKGYLMLRQELRNEHNIRSLNVTVDIGSAACFGDEIARALLHHLVGYDTVVMNWLISIYQGQGYLYTAQSKEMFNLNYAAELLASTEDWEKYGMFKAGVVFTTLFLFFTTTTLVSFTLRETQERMLKFTFHLQYHVRNRLPYAPLILTHVVESLVFVPIMVGVLLFLSEFFSDQLLAFMVLSMVWAAEVYSVIAVRTAISVRFFPKLFFFYFVLFHIYFFSFPFGFSYLALMSIVTFLQHSMLFFWNRYEVPALQSGAVSAANPRPAGVIISGPGTLEELLLAQTSHHPLLAVAAGEAAAAEGTEGSSPLIASNGGGLPSRDSGILSEGDAASGSDAMDHHHHHRNTEGILHDLVRSEYNASLSPPSPFSLFFNAPNMASFRSGPYSHRYDETLLVDAVSRAALVSNEQTGAGVGLRHRFPTPLSGASSSEDFQRDVWLFGGRGSGHSTRRTATPSHSDEPRNQEDDQGGGGGQPSSRSDSAAAAAAAGNPTEASPPSSS